MGLAAPCGDVDVKEIKTKVCNTKITLINALSILHNYIRVIIIKIVFKLSNLWFVGQAVAVSPCRASQAIVSSLYEFVCDIKNE